METLTLVTKNEIKISKGTIIPMLSSTDEPIGFEITIPSGSLLRKRKGCTITKYEGNLAYERPYDSAIFKFILDKAIEDGCIPIITEDNKKVFKMFSIITENRITPEEGRYITEFDVDDFEQAQHLASEFAKNNFPPNIKYKIRK
jgi:hypothetical protein